MTINDSSPQFSVVLGGYVDMGGGGKAKVVSLELEPATGIVYFTVRSATTDAETNLFLLCPGGGEFA